jgi:outer membrane protein TolC
MNVLSMPRTRAYLLSASTIILMVWTGNARGVQPLAEFVQAAEKNNFDARESRAAARQRGAEADVALGRLLPSGTARGVYSRNQFEVAVQLPGSANRLTIQPEDQLDAFLQVDVPLLDLASMYRLKSARSVARAGELQSQAANLDVARSVTRAYFQFIGGSALLDTAKRSVGVAVANLENVANRRGAGVATDVDHARAQANVERAKQDIADAELAVALSARSLETLSGLLPSKVDTVMADDLHEEAPLATWLKRTGETPQDKVARELALSADQARTASDMALVPTLTATGQERFTNATGFAGRSAYYTLQLVASWRLDYGLVQGRHVQDAAREAADVRNERTQRVLADQVFESYRRVENAIARSRAARAEALAAAKAAELSSDRYAAGVSTQLDVTQAQRDAFLADAKRIQADADLAFARASLRLAAGIAPFDTRTP